MAQVLIISPFILLLSQVSFHLHQIDFVHSFILSIDTPKIHHHHHHHHQKQRQPNKSPNHPSNNHARQFPLQFSREVTEEGNNDKNSSNRSVGDVVKGLHGGKYQFDSEGSSLLPGMSVVGQQFAESLYGGGGSSNDKYKEEEDPEPRWAQRMSPPSSSTDAVVVPCLEYSLPCEKEGQPVQSHAVVISNKERSWEKFYAKLFPVPTNGEEGASSQGEVPHFCPFVVEPRSGFLAPRGGASNVCDENKPYSDSARIVVRCVSDNGGDRKSISRMIDWFLVVSTEEETWNYRLVMKD